MRDQIAALLAAYDLGEVAEIVAVEGRHANRPHFVRAERGRFLARMLAPACAAPAMLATRHAFLDHLARAGVRVPRLVRARDGRGAVPADSRALELTGFIPGRPPRPGDLADAEAVGELLGAMQVAAADFHPLFPGSRHELTDPQPDLTRLARLEQQVRVYLPAPEVMAGLASLKAGVSETASALAGADLPEGMLHGDLRPQSILFADRGPHAVGFDLCHRGPLILDLAMALIAFAGHASPEFGKTFDAEAARALLAGYSRRRPLTSGETRALDAAATRVLVHRRLRADTSLETLAGLIAEWRSRRELLGRLVAGQPEK